MSKFFGQEVLKAKYFRQTYLHGAAEGVTARSGYWRLFIYQLQEEALKLDEEKVENATTKNIVVTTPVRKKRTQRKQIIPAEIVVPKLELPPFKRKAVYTEPAVNELLQQGAQLPSIVVNVQEKNVVNLRVAYTKRKQHVRRRVAAFLLLAA